MNFSHMKPVSIVIVGGGTAGWITANILWRRLCYGVDNPVNITLVESRRIGIVGVGEATIPSIRKLMKFLDIRETDLMKETSATFKQGIHYRNWQYAPKRATSNTYFHPFDASEFLNFNPALWWLKHRALQSSSQYAEDVCPQFHVAAAGRTPRPIEMREYDGHFGYAYHLDAEALAEFLAKRGVAAGITRLIDDVLDCAISADGAVSSITTKENGVIEGDFFIDCTGFSALLLSKTLNVGFESYNDQLFCDRAVAFRIPTEETSTIRPFTTTTAKSSGWIWDIDIQTRRGTGYVYSSNHISQDNAEIELRQHIGRKADKLDARHLKMRVGRSREFWKSNVVGIGLSAGFIEPLESTGIFLIEEGAMQLGNFLLSLLSSTPKNTLNFVQDFLVKMPKMRSLYNDRMMSLYEEIRDFIKIHYYLSKRDDSLFWQQNRRAATVSDSLLEMLDRWTDRPPASFDFTLKSSVFGEHNWLYIMLGMGWRPKNINDFNPLVSAKMGQQLMMSVRRTTSEALKVVPDHRAYFKAISTETAGAELLVSA